MNNKHLACLFIGALIFLQLYGIIAIKAKRDAMTTEAEDASLAAESARQQLHITRIQLASLKSRTDALRQYLGIWDTALHMSPTEEEGQTRINDLIRQGGITQLSGKYDPSPNPGNSLISKVLKAELLFEDDYHKSLDWLGEVERTLPAARISKCRLTKGTTSNDIKMEMTVELPVIDISGTSTPKA
jgi:hypothetical protein